MKKYVYALVMFMPHLIIPCVPSQSGQRVWDIATKNIFITQSIESSLNELTSIDVTFSNLDQLFDKVTIVKSKASYLLQEIDSLQNNLIEDLSQTEQIQSNIGLIESNFALLDLSSVFTALDALQTTVVSAMDLLNTDLEIIESNIDDLAASQVQYFQTVASQLDRLDEDVTTINSVLEALSAQFSLITFGSITDLIQRDLATLESNVDVLADQLAGGFQGTFSVLEQNLELAQTIESLVDTLDVMDESDLTGTYSLLDQLEISVQTMDSLADLLIDTFDNIESAIDVLGSALDESVSKYMFVESRTSLLVQKIEDLILNPAFSRMDHATSLLDQDISLLENAYTADLPALTTSIESKLDHIIGQQYQQISDLDSMMSNVSAIANIQNGTIISKIEITNSLLNDTLDDAFATESYLDPATHSEQLFAITDNVQTLHEQLSYVDLVVLQISSKMILVDDLLVTTDSTLDIVNATVLNNINDAIALESMVDTLSVTQPSGNISSVLDVINSQEDVVISKLAIASNLIASENIESQGLINDFQSTWTILQSIDTKLTQAYSSLSLTDAAIDAKFVSYSSVFTIIDTIVLNESTINSQVDVYNSMVDALTNTINIDFNGVFTALTNVNSSMMSTSNMLSTISSKLSNIQTELGFPIYQTNIPLTINTPGRYYLAENINYSGASNAITINTNDVSIDLNDRTFNYTGASTTSIGVFINNVSNIKIINGTMSNSVGNSGNFATGSGTSTNVIIHNVRLKGAGIILNGSGRNLKLYHLTGSGVGNSSDAIGIFDHTNIDIQCRFVKSAGIGSRGAAVNVVCENCYVNNNRAGNVGGFGFNGTPSNWVIKNSYTDGGLFGIFVNVATVTGVSAINCCFTNKANQGIYLAGTSGVIKNNIMLRTSTGLVTSATAASSDCFIGFNNFIQNTVGNISIVGRAHTVLGNFAFNTNAVGNPNNTNYSVSGSDITGKFVTISQRTGIAGAIVPTYWHNINMLP